MVVQFRSGVIAAGFSYPQLLNLSGLCQILQAIVYGPVREVAASLPQTVHDFRCSGMIGGTAYYIIYGLPLRSKESLWLHGVVPLIVIIRISLIIKRFWIVSNRSPLI
jgi:hypothetical protein